MSTIKQIAVLAAFISMAGARPCCAQWLGADYATYGAPMSNFGVNTMMNNSAMINAAAESSRQAAESSRQAPVRANAAPALSRNAEELAQRFPSDQQEQMRKAYIDCMRGYQKIEAKMGWPANDLGGAVAAFIVGNYMVFAWREVSDAEFAAVAEQFRRQSGWQASMRKLAPAKARNLYEQSAMVGTFMALAHKSLGPAPQPEKQARLRQVAADNLKLVVGADPASIRIDSRGLSLTAQ